MNIYRYRQNNSGGTFIEPAVNVYIEANSPAEADAIALTKGIYFDPEFEIDCDCCGERWNSASDFDVVIAIPTPSDFEEAMAELDNIPAQMLILA